jgi:curved DNA-binding protein CbpA
MKLDSPLFNRIRVKPAQDPRPRPQAPVCQWPGCALEGSHRAPKGRMREREYWRFCLEHVREYNQSYNYFAGMSDDAVARYQKDAVTGHRPTWKMGLNGGSDKFHGGETPIDPFDVMREFGGAGARTRERPAQEARPVHNAERKAFDTLGLEIDAQAAEIKARFKELVKRHHPDANGGDRSTEHRLIEIIQAYNYLKSAKFC